MSLPAVYFDYIGLCQKYGLRHPCCAINAIKLVVWFAFKTKLNQFVFGTVYCIRFYIYCIFIYHILLHLLRNKKNENNKRKNCFRTWAGAMRHPDTAQWYCSRDGSADERSLGCSATLEHRQHPHYGRLECRLQLRKWHGSCRPLIAYWPTVHVAHWRWRWHIHEEQWLCLWQVRCAFYTASTKSKPKYFVITLKFVHKFSSDCACSCSN